MSSIHKIDKEVARRIKEAAQENSKTLVLFRMELTEIPNEVFELHQLESLNLSDNYIRIIPDRIRELRNLKRLNLFGNPIKQVPDISGLELDWAAYHRCRKSLSRQNILGIQVKPQTESGQSIPLLSEILRMTNLRRLSVSIGQFASGSDFYKPEASIKDLIDGLDRFKSLEALHFFGIRFEELPPGIRSLTSLRTLNVHGTVLRRVPAWLSELKELATLAIGHSNIRALPETLGTLPRLQALWFPDSHFSEFPEVLFQIKELRELDLAQWHKQGKIKKIPASILDLTHLQTLRIGGHPIEEPPLEVVEQGLAAIKNYWRQQQESGVDYLCEAKLIIVGEAGAGKTSLAKKIRDRAYALKPQESSTEGIEVLRWNFPAAVRVNQAGKEELLQRNFRVNIWDFGGQEIYHATHQFFLTRRSLYVLVSDDRKEDIDFQYWLQVVALLSGHSPLLVVQNEKQDRQRDIDLGGLRARFPNLKEAYRTNLATNRGLDTLVKAIRHELERLPHIGSPLPKTWARVRDALEKDPRDYISLEEYLDICQRHGFTRQEDKLQLSGYLHDLGICLHFQDDPVLKSRVILKPRWGTDAVYRVLDDHSILDHRGRFGLRDLERIWSEDKYAPMRDELLRLMMKFQLCYQLPEREEFIAPQLLSAARPAYKWDDNKNLIVQYQYGFMPKGLITRFIVGSHHLIADQSLVWKSGVVIERDRVRGEVIEDYQGRKIVVRISGPDTRGLLAIVDDQLDRIHRSFPHLKYEKYLPCNCAVCRDSREPFLYPLTELQDFAKDGDSIQCRTSRKMVDAAHLLRDVLPSAVYSVEPRTGQKSFDLPQKEVPAEPARPREVYVSYAWTDESNALVDQLEAVCKEYGIALIRERNELRYKDSIRDFMSRMGQGKCIVVVLSKSYLESKSCMFELTEIADRGDLGNRVFPIVLADTNVYDADGRLDYIEYWEKKTNKLNARMKKVKGTNLQGIREELDLYEKIRATLARILEILGDMNALPPEQHRTTGFEELLRTLDAPE
jgi:internalin A